MATLDRNEGNSNEKRYDLSDLSIAQQFSATKYINTVKNASREQAIDLAIDAYLLSVRTRNMSGKLLKEKVMTEFKDAGMIQ